MKLVRSSNLIAYWDGRKFILEEFERRRRISVSPLATLLLDRFSHPHSPTAVARSFPPYSARSVERELKKLRTLGFLLPARRSQVPSLLESWGDSLAAAQYHCSLRDVRFAADQADIDQILRTRLAASPQPPLYKLYPDKPSFDLPKKPQPHSATLQDTLLRRRTVRDFAPKAVPFRKLAAVISGTWGQTGWLDGGILGNLVSKTSPSGGARHPIECYVIISRVEGLAPGLYHYSVRSNSLEQLRTADLRDEAIEIASGQRWVGDSSFICLMTAVVARVFWKYSARVGYRVLYLDAGHLGQTFSLLATAMRLGPFTTGAIQQNRAERLLGLDGITEIPVYLCGAGVPASRSRRSPARRRRRPSPVVNARVLQSNSGRL